MDSGSSVEMLALRTASLVAKLDDAEGLTFGLIDLIRSVVPASFAYAQYFTDDKSPVVIYPESYRAPPGWAEGLYLIDPLWQEFNKAAADEASIHTLLEVAPAEFEGTDYYKHVYLSNNVVDELVHLTTTPEGNSFVFAFCRSRKNKPFSANDRAVHKALHPLVAAAGNRLQNLLDDEFFAKSKATRRGLEAAVNAFGLDDGLTPRESDVVQLVLRGHNSHSVANKLSIAADTVKLHRKHIYAKLKVGSQGELFFRFLESIGFRDEDTPSE